MKNVSDLLSYYDAKLRELIKTGRGTLSQLIDQCTTRVPFGYARYSSNRWLRYLDNYFEGGRPLLDFIEAPINNKSALVYLTSGNARHTDGPCIVSITKTKDIYHINMRTMSWCGAGVLDLNLVWLLQKKTNTPVWITCPLVKVMDWELVTYPKLELLPRVSLVRKALALRHKEPSQVKFGMLRANLKIKPSSQDEEEVILNFPRITPEDLAYHFGLVGCKVRNILRKFYGYSTKGEERRSHSWSSLEDPRLLHLLGQLKISKRGFPCIDELVRERLERIK